MREDIICTENKEEKKEPYVLQVEDLVVRFHSGDETIHSVNGVSFHLKQGETLAIVGESGAGKSVLGKSIMSILPHPQAEIERGHIYINGKDIIGMTEKQLRKIRGKQISMIFQDPLTALSPVFTIGNQIEEAYREHNKVTRKQAREKTKELLKMVGIPEDRYKDYPHQFSGGMRQRVVIAMALACDPDILVADEPTTALDVTIQAQILELINDLKEKYHTSVILITHDLGIVAENCDKVIIMYAGQIVEYGSKEEIFRNAVHPYTKGLFQAIPSVSCLGQQLNPIKGLPPDPGKLPAGCPFCPRCPCAGDRCPFEKKGLIEVAPDHFSRCARG